MLIKVNAIPDLHVQPGQHAGQGAPTEHPGLGFSIKGKQHTVTYVLHRDTEEALHFLPAPEERMVSGATKVVIYK